MSIIKRILVSEKESWPELAYSCQCGVRGVIYKDIEMNKGLVENQIAKIKCAC